MATLITFAI